MSKNTLKILGENIKYFKEQENIDIRKLGFTDGEIEQLEEGKYCINLIQLDEIADLLGVSPASLIKEQEKISAKQIVRALRMDRFLENAEPNKLICVYYVISLMMEIMHNVDVKNALRDIGIDVDFE